MSQDGSSQSSKFKSSCGSTPPTFHVLTKTLIDNPKKKREKKNGYTY